MDSFHARAVDSLLQDPACNQSEDLVSACMVNSVIRFSSIMTGMFARGQNTITDEERGVIFEDLKLVTNNVMILFHALDADAPEADSLREYSEDIFPTEVAVDGVLCSIQCLGAIADLSSIIYDPDLEDFEEDGSDAEEVFDEVQQTLCEIYAGIITLCDISGIDFEEVAQHAADLKSGEQDWSLA